MTAKSNGLTTMVGMLALCFGCATSARPEEPTGRLTIIMFGASWCAPCRAELRQLSALAGAAAPDRIEVAWIDRAPPQSMAAAGGNVAILSTSEANRKFEALIGSSQGLPATALLNSKGKLCAVFRQPLNPPALKNLRASC